MKRYFFIVILFLATGVFQVQAGEKSSLARVLTFAGRSYPSTKSPEYSPYDNALRAYLVERIQRESGVNLDPKKYSAFDLLEIESLFRCKKPSESFDLFIRGFPKEP